MSAGRACYFYAEKFNQDENVRNVKDHYHYTGKVWDPAHLICNLKYKEFGVYWAIFHY